MIYELENSIKNFITRMELGENIYFNETNKDTYNIFVGNNTFLGFCISGDIDSFYLILNSEIEDDNENYINITYQESVSFLPYTYRPYLFSIFSQTENIERMQTLFLEEREYERGKIVLQTFLPKSHILQSTEIISNPIMYSKIINWSKLLD